MFGMLSEAQMKGAKGGKGVPVGPPTSLDPGYARVREGLLQQWKRLFEDQTFKDVEIILGDGERVMADSLVLKMASPVFCAMLSHQMLERQTMSLSIEDCTGPAFRFFLRLLYTGQMEPSEWPEDSSEEQQLRQPQEHQPQQDQTQAASWPSSIFGSPERQAPAQPPTPIQPSFGAQDMAQAFPRGGSLFGTSQPAAPAPPPLAVVVGSGMSEPLPAAAMAPLPPIDVLLAAAALAKKYQVEWLLSVLVDVLKKRLTERSFERILAAAMRLDLAPVRLCALEFAKVHPSIRERYNSGDFPPEVMFEMQAVFPLRRLLSSDLSI